MRNRLNYALKILLLISTSFAIAQAQGEVRIARRATVPTSCDPAGITGPALVLKTSTTSDTCGTAKGLCVCSAADTWSPYPMMNTGVVGSSIAIWNSSKFLTSLTLTNGQLAIGSTGGAPVAAALTGTSNQVNVVPGAGTITLSTPQNIHSGATPTFAGANLTDSILNTNVAAPATPAAGVTRTWVDSTDKILKSKNDSGTTAVTVIPNTAVTSQAITTIASTGAITQNTVETLLSTFALVDLNTGTATTLYTCPTGRSCVITKVTIRNASTSLTTASISFGWVSAAFNDVIANATHTELTGATLYKIVDAKAGARVGTTTEQFRVIPNTPQGAPASVTIDVFGYTF